MKILIDFTQIPIKKSGVGTYAVNLVQKISTVNTNDRDMLYVLIQDDDRVFENFPDIRFHFISVNNRIFRRLLPRFFLEQLIIPWLILKHGIDVVHSLHYSFPLFSFAAKKVITIHDMTFFLFPEYHLPFKRYYFRFWIRMAAVFADRIITVSQSTRDDFFRFTRGNKPKVTVIPLAASKMELSDSSEIDFHNVREKYHIKNDYLLFIGTIEPRKNICRLIYAVEKLIQEMPDYTYTLVLIGQRGWGYEKVMSLVQSSMARDHIIFTEFVEETEKLLLLKHAKLFVYPSIYEGFGLPVLEAMNFGIPTVTSNISSMPEIAGNAALKVNPFHVDEIYNAIKLLLIDNNLYCNFKEKARHQAGLFSWEKTAVATLQVYNSCKIT